MIKPLKYNYKPEVTSIMFFSLLQPDLVRTENNSCNSAFHKKRKDIIKLLLDMVHKMKFKSLTFYLALFYIDIIFSKDHTTTCFELFALSCLILATKFCENDSIIPTLSHFLGISKLNFQVEEIKKFEIKSLQQLAYKLNHFSSYEYTNLFLYNGIVFEDEDLRSTQVVTENDSPNIKSTQSSSYNSRGLESSLIIEKLYSHVKEVLITFIQGMFSYIKF